MPISSWPTVLGLLCLVLEQMSNDKSIIPYEYWLKQKASNAKY